MLTIIFSVLLAVFAAYCFFCSGMSYLSAYTTGMLIPFRRDTLVSSVVGITALVAALYLMRIA